MSKIFDDKAGTERKPYVAPAIFSYTKQQIESSVGPAYATYGDPP